MNIAEVVPVRPSVCSLADGDARLAGHRPSRLPADLALAMTTSDGAEPIMCATVRPATDSGRIELFSQHLEDRFGYGLPRYEPVERRYPLTIISPSSAKRTNATFGLEFIVAYRYPIYSDS